MAAKGASRAREAWRIMSNEGPYRLAQRISRASYQRLGADRLEFPLDLDDIADSRELTLAVPQERPRRGTPLSIGWVCTPPSRGSGGHTTLFRMVEASEAAGHACFLYLYDRFHGQLARHEKVIRDCWPNMRAEVRSAMTGMAPLDAYVASGWPTAHVLAARAQIPTRRLYLIQDFEPFFYPHGSEYSLAEDTYRFGFRCISVGRMVAEILEKQFNVMAQVAEHGCDASVYKLTNPAPRTGVVFYAKPGVSRRGFELGVLALQEFHRRCPEHEIHIFGDSSARTPFPAVNHGSLSPARLSTLYNHCRAGIVMSFTNVSLVPAEMLACGVVPAIVGPPNVRPDLDSALARWTEPSARSLADELCAIVADPEPSPAAIAASMNMAGWDSAQRVVVETIEDEVYGPPSDCPPVPGMASVSRQPGK
jgi:glycosyltransferase involved in cell wall biosynthesis